jgi:hypothetical protein
MMIRLLEMGVALTLLIWWFVILLAATCVGVGYLEEPKGYLWGLIVGTVPLGIGHRYLTTVFERKLEEEKKAISGGAGVEE